MPAATARRARTAGDLTAPAYVVLGMVRLGARSGYEIKQAVEQSIRFFWTISQVQIYPSLAELEATGLIVGRDEPQGNRPRRVYDITSAGERALEEWLRRPDPLPFELRDLGLVKLFFADALPARDALDLVRAISGRSAERVETLGAIESVADEAAEAGDIYPFLTLRMGIAFHKAMIDVCDEFEREAAGRMRRRRR
jgi:DNA-binding PadR family transcriptional regulator